MGFIGTVLRDIRAVKTNDPAAKNYAEILFCHTPLWTILMYRCMHPFAKMQLPLFPRFMMTLAKIVTGVEIHPCATIGSPFFIDHGVGVVIGETTIIGNNCTLFQNVTLGGTGKHTGKRHPTLGNNVLVGAGATLLGPLTVGDNVNIGAGTFIMMSNVPSNATVVGVPGKIVKLNGKKVHKVLTQFT